MGAFDNDLSVANSRLNAANAALAAAAGRVTALQAELQQEQAIVATQTAGLPGLRTALDQATSAVGAAQQVVQGFIIQQRSLSLQEPPWTIPDPNWPAHIAALLQTVNADKTNLANAQKDVAEAQAAVDAEAELEPDETNNGKPNPAHGRWVIRMHQLEATLDAAKAASAAAQQAVAAAQAAYDAAVNGPVPVVGNPAHDTWLQQMQQIGQQLDAAKQAATAAIARQQAAQAQLDAANNVIAAAQQRIAAIPADLQVAQAAVEAARGPVALAQAGVDQVVRWQTVLAGTATDQALIAEVVHELLTRRAPAEQTFDADVAVALQTDEAAWRLAQRVAELTDQAGRLSDLLGKLDQHHHDFVQAQAAVVNYLATQP